MDMAKAREPVAIKDWKEFREDLHAFGKLVNTEFPNLPIYIAGHCLGGVITLDDALHFEEGSGSCIDCSGCFI